MPKPPFGFETPEDNPGFLLWQTTMIWQRLIKKALDSYGISHAQFVIMASLLWFKEMAMEVTQVFIINQTKLDKMTVSKSLKKLTEQGLIQRTEYEKDTRAKQVTLTKEGIQLSEILIPIVEKIDKQFFGQLSMNDQKRFLSLLNHLVSKSTDSLPCS